MKRCIKNTLLAGLIILLSTYAYAQNIARGTIKDETGTALPGAAVIEKGLSSNAVVTDNNGKFSLSLKGSSKEVTIKYLGYETVTVKVTDALLAITLKPSKNDMNEVVVIGYQSQKMKNVTAAISSIKGDDIKNTPEASFDMMLQGRLAGVNVQSSTGEPGAKPNIIIRGTTNIDYGNGNGGNTGPLYVIDGVVFDVNNMGGSYTYSNPLSLINPADIESIDVLKDASASAIYGARAGNGVIIVTTRKAKRLSRPQVSMNVFAGITTRPKFKTVAIGTAERNLKLQLLNNQLGYGDIQNGTIPQALTDSLNPAFNNNIDWQGMLIREHAFVHSEDVSVAGFMSDNNSYRLSFNHYAEEGALKGYSVQRLVPHLTLTLNPIKHVSITADMILSSERRHHGAGAANTFFYNSWSFPTSLSQLNDEQIQLFSGQYNSFDDNHVTTINGSVKVSDTLTRELVLVSNFGANSYSDKWDYYSPAVLNGVQNIAYDIDAGNPSWTWDNYFQYNKKLKKHNFTLVGGVAASMAKQYYTYAYAAGISVTGIHTLQTVPSGANLFVNTSKQTKTTESYYGRLSYDYNGKYLFTASLRADASSIYSADYRWGKFPSLSAGWIISNEKFFQPLTKVANFIKLRASWGITGQDPGSWYAKYQALYADGSFLGATTGTLAGSTGNVYLSGTPSSYNGATVISPFPYYNNFSTAGTKSSSDVRWEKYPQTDIGADINLWNDRIGIAFDVYRKDAKDKYLWQIPASPTSGYAYYSGNYVDIRNEGIELGFNTRNFGPSSKFQWNTSFNIAFNRNYITKLPNGGRDLDFGAAWFRRTLTVGEPVFSYKTWQVKGVYAVSADVPTDPITGNKMTYFGTTLQAGDANIKDLNGDYNIDYNDQVVSGNPNPKATGGITNTFTYKGISLTVFCSYSYGNKIINGYISDALNGSASYSSWGSVAGPAAYSDILNQFWTRPGDQTKFPRLVYGSGTTSSIDPWNVGRSYFLEDGSFFKLKQITLGYNLPPTWLQRVHLKNVNVYAMAQNLYIWKKANVPDPELYDPTTGSVNTVYPTGLKLTLGLHVDL